ncbi:MAG TPA: hypothetical protein P5037_11375, partial [Candidatus Paceibacterota bacterium]|nr:hypothetical protein [Verrucomicrobiota bacterium]HRD03565.1 hypothetical protein [Verrucomicrobiota bacterium]HRY59364.1 hypothetical protein [Candidatus Paceibacterota bacterium]HRZ70127.1 hypothetical protein [Candidatus Paceibacterota bacterium]
TLSGNHDNQFAELDGHNSKADGEFPESNPAEPQDDARSPRRVRQGGRSSWEVKQGWRSSGFESSGDHVRWFVYVLGACAGHKLFAGAKGQVSSEGDALFFRNRVAAGQKERECSCHSCRCDSRTREQGRLAICPVVG